MSDLSVLLEVVETFCGKLCRYVYEGLLKDYREYVDEELAGRLGMNVNDVRKALYDLQSLGLVSYKRVRDESEAKFIYYWRAEVDSLNQAILQRKRTVLRRLEDRLRMEEGTAFYECPNDGFRLTFDEALENEFVCPKCGSLLEYSDNTVIKRRLRELVAMLREELGNEERSVGS